MFENKTDYCNQKPASQDSALKGGTDNFFCRLFRPVTICFAILAAIVVTAIVPGIAMAQAGDEEAAWEYRPYKVRVLFCSDGSPEIEANIESIGSELVRRSQLIDASSWALDVQSPPRPLQWAMLESIARPDALTEMLATDTSVAAFDKLTFVCLSTERGKILTRVRELDLQTQQWGPLGERLYDQMDGIHSGLILSVKNSFMPIAEVDRVTEYTLENGRPADKVFLRSRAIHTCKRARQVANPAEIPGDGIDNDENGIVDDAFVWTVEQISDSPVWVKMTDRFLPILRQTNVQGELLSLTPIEFTYLTIDEQEEAKFVCSIQSYHRAPLSGRRKKTLRKLALVIRPPDSSTILKLVSRDEVPIPLEGYQVKSGFPGATKIEEFEDLGQTDWRGLIEIPPSEHGMRLLFILHGDRRLMKLPMIPGMYAEQETAVPDDETRLYAEGIIAGLQTEILNLVAQRNVYEAEIELALEADRPTEAREILNKYQRLPTPQDIKNRLADERTGLKIKTSDRRELEYIETMFNTLSDVLTSKVMDSNETNLRRQLQDPTFVPPPKEEVDDDAELQESDIAPTEPALPAETEQEDPAQ